MNIIEKNTNMLQSFNFGKLLGNVSFREVDKELVSYVNLMVDKTSGEMLDITQGIRIVDNSFSTPLAVKRKDFFSNFYLELIIRKEEEIPESIQDVLKKSLLEFNKL